MAVAAYTVLDGLVQNNCPSRAQGTTMSDSNKLQLSSAPSYVSRVLNNDSTRKGAAAALAGLFVAVVSEALWPSTRS